MSERVLLGMDLGTTGNRVVAYGEDGAIRAQAYYEFPQIFPQPGWVEHDPLQILESALRALREVAQKVGPGTVTALGITNQRETTILWDRKTGVPVFNAIVWQCRRTSALCDQYRPHAQVIKDKTGLFLDAYFSATKIRWILNEVPGVRERAAKGEILFGTVDTWLLWNLTGGRVHATEASNASRTMLYNIRELRYDAELLKLFGIPEAILPEVKDSRGEFGMVDKKFLGREFPVTAILGDQQASLFAQGAWKPGIVKNTYGTGLFVMTNTGQQIPASGRLVNTVAWKWGREVSYAMEGSIFVGGACIQWLRDGLHLFKDAAESERLAKSVASNEGVYLVPAFVGLGAPYWDPDARGLLIGITRGTGAAHMARAALESLAYQTCDVVEEMKKNMPGLRFEKLRVDGGAVKNDFLMQFQADMLGFAVERPVHTETTVFGAAGLAGIHSGFWTLNEYEKFVRGADRIFSPTLAPESRDRYHDIWKLAVERCRRWAAETA